jgi:pectate lyase
MRLLAALTASLVLGCGAATGLGPDGQTPPADAAAPDDAAAPTDAATSDASPPPDAANDADQPEASLPLDATPDAIGDAPDPGLAYPPVGVPFPIEGFGAATRGGWQDGGDVCHVTTLDDDGAGSLRECTRSGGVPRVIVFDLDGEIPLVAPIILPSNLTIDGRGRRVTLRGKGFVIPADEVILVNLAFLDVGDTSQDAVQIGSATDGPSERIVLDHLRFTQTGDLGDSTNVDEAMSVVFGSTDITIAWCRVEQWEKVLLCGNGDVDGSVDGSIRVTFHHNLARSTGRRHPQARYGQYDFFNNLFDDWHMYGWLWEPPYRESFCAQAQDGARLRFEGNLARRTVHPYDALTQANDVTRCETGGVIEEVDTLVLPDSTAPLQFLVGCAASAAVPRPYAATVDTADAVLRARLEAATGNVL